MSLRARTARFAMLTSRIAAAFVSATPDKLHRSNCGSPVWLTIAATQGVLIRVCGPATRAAQGPLRERESTEASNDRRELLSCAATTATAREERDDRRMQWWAAQACGYPVPCLWRFRPRQIMVHIEVDEYNQSGFVQSVRPPAPDDGRVDEDVQGEAYNSYRESTRNRCRRNVRTSGRGPYRAPASCASQGGPECLR